MSSKLKINYTLITLLIIISFIMGFFVYQQVHQAKHFDPSTLHGTYVPPGRTVTSFKLTNVNNELFQASDLVGHWTLLFFGFTQCHSICPTTMATLHKMNLILKDDKNMQVRPQVYMISLDPQRDTIETLRQYVKGFDADFLGALGPKAMIDKLSQHLGIVYDAETRKDGQIDHSGSVIAINPAGEVAAFFTPPLNPQWMADDLVVLMQQFVNH